MLSLETLREVNAERGIQWNGGKPSTIDDLAFRAMELGGETGEALNVCKKLVRTLNGWVGGVTLDEAKPQIADELADVIICVDRVAEVLGIDLSAAIVEKFNKTSRKHGFIEIEPTDLADTTTLRSALVRTTGSLGLIIKGADVNAPGHRENYLHARAVLDGTTPDAITDALSAKCASMGISFEEGVRRLASGS